MSDLILTWEFAFSHIKMPRFLHECERILVIICDTWKGPMFLGDWILQRGIGYPLLRGNDNHVKTKIVLFRQKVSKVVTTTGCCILSWFFPNLYSLEQRVFLHLNVSYIFLQKKRSWLLKQILSMRVGAILMKTTTSVYKQDLAETSFKQLPQSLPCIKWLQFLYLILSYILHITRWHLCLVNMTFWFLIDHHAVSQRPAKTMLKRQILFDLVILFLSH